MADIAVWLSTVTAPGSRYPWFSLSQHEGVGVLVIQLSAVIEQGPCCPPRSQDTAGRLLFFFLEFIHKHTCAHAGSRTHANAPKPNQKQEHQQMEYAKCLSVCF